ncbi:MAG: RodZ domain-containing protein [Bryobacteraceae bacterium]
MTSVGNMLKSAREQQGRSIAQIAEELRIMQRYVTAIETGDTKNLPGTFFYKSFVRQYAALLGIEGAAIDEAIASLSAPEVPVAAAIENTSKPLDRPNPFRELLSRIHFSDHPLGVSLASLAGALVLCSGFYAWWSRAPQAVPEPVAAVQTATPQSQPPNANAVTVSAAGATEGKDASAVIPEGVPQQNIDVTGGTDQPVVLSVSAREKTWLRITSNGQTIFSGILWPSESKVLRGSDVATMKVGNAAGLEVRLNGKPIGPLGERGQVRTVRFTRENFEILPAADTTVAPSNPNTL